MRLPVSHFVPLAAVALLAGCGMGGGGERAAASLPPSPANGPAADYPMVIGDSYTIDGVTYQPADVLNYDAVGYVAIDPAGEQRISGSHKTLPVPSYVEVTSLASGKTILVRIERRGPMTNSKLLGLSPGALEQLGLAGDPNPAVRVRRVNPPEPERAALRRGEQAPPRMETPQSLLAVLRRRLDQNGQVTLNSGPNAARAAAMGTAGAPASQPPAAAASPSPSTRPAANPRPVATTPAAPAPTPRPTASAQPVATAHPATTAAPAAMARPAAATAAPATGAVVVQVGAFSTRERAAAAAAQVDGTVTQAGRLWRVRAGPFANAAAAQAALAKARSAGYRDARIQRAD